MWQTFHYKISHQHGQIAELFVEGGAPMHFIDVWTSDAPTKHVWAPPFTQVQRHSTMNMVMWLPQLPNGFCSCFMYHKWKDFVWDGKINKTTPPHTLLVTKIIMSAASAVLCVVGAIWTMLILLVRIAYTTLRYLVTIVWLKAGSQCGFDIQCHWQVWFAPCVGSDQKYKCVWLWPSSSFFRNKELVPKRIREERGEGKERGGR